MWVERSRDRMGRDSVGREIKRQEGEKQCVYRDRERGKRETVCREMERLRRNRECYQQTEGEKTRNMKAVSDNFVYSGLRTLNL